MTSFRGSRWVARILICLWICGISRVVLRQIQATDKDRPKGDAVRTALADALDEVHRRGAGPSASGKGSQN